MKKIARQGGEVVLIGGTPVNTQRRTGKANRKDYAGIKHRIHGLPFLALTDERGRLIWISATRAHKLTPAQQVANRVVAVGRTPVEHGFARPRTGACWPNSAPTPPAPPNSCAPSSSWRTSRSNR